MPYWIFIVGLGIVIQTIFIFFEYGTNKLAALFAKSAAAAVFVILGILLSCESNDPRYAWYITAGLIFGMGGDVFLALRTLYQDKKSTMIFAIGIASFLIGHLVYIVVLLKLILPSFLIAFVASIILSGILIPLMLKNINAPQKGLKIFGIIYFYIILLMFSCAALFLFLIPSTRSILFAIGAFLFTLSDFGLIFHLFGKKKVKYLRAANLSCYYIAQILICLTILYV